MKAGVLAADAQGLGAHGLAKRLQRRVAPARIHAARLAHVARKLPSSRKRASVICSIRLPDRPVLRRASAKAGASALGTTA